MQLRHRKRAANVVVLKSHCTWTGRWPYVGGTKDGRENRCDMTERLAVWMSRHQGGQGLAEYALLLALIAIIAIAALLFLGGSVSTLLSNVGTSI